MLTILCVYHSLVSSERFYGETFYRNTQETFQNMTSTLTSTTSTTNLLGDVEELPPLHSTSEAFAPGSDSLDLDTGLLDSEFWPSELESEILESATGILESVSRILESETGHESEILKSDTSNPTSNLNPGLQGPMVSPLTAGALRKQDDNISNDHTPRKRDSVVSMYYDARSSMSQDQDFMSSQGEEEGDDEQRFTEKRVLDKDGEGLQICPDADIFCEESSQTLPNENSSLNRNDVSNNQELKSPSSETNGYHLDTVAKDKASSPFLRGNQHSLGKSRRGCQSSSHAKDSTDLTSKSKGVSHDDTLFVNQTKLDANVTTGPLPDDKCPSSQGRLARLGKVLSPGQYQSTTLGRQARKSRRVPGPVAPEKPGRGNRSQTEPPPELASPDILQVSWVWETRSPTRSTSIRRRPSRKVSCRRKSRPRLAPRRSSGSRGSNSPRRKFSGISNQTIEENRSDTLSVEDKQTKDQTLSPPPAACIFPPPDILSYGHSPNSPSKRFLPCCDINDILSNTLPRGVEEPKEVKLREKRTSNYLLSASKALKQKWRNSEILLPRFLNEAVENVKNSKSEPNKKKDFLERAKALPLKMRKLSHLIFKTSKHKDHVDLYVKNADSPILFLELQGLASRLGKRRKSVRRPNGVGIKRQSSFSPGNSFKRNSSINWSQKYQNVMGGRARMSGSGLDDDDGYGTYGPVIQVTEADNEDEAFISEGDTVSTTGSVLSRLHPLHHKGGVLDRIISRIRARSLSTSRSFASSRSSMSGGSEDGHSPSHSSDYEDQDENERSGSASLVGRMRGLRRDMQKKISRLKSPRGSTSSSPGPLPGDKAAAGLPGPGQPPTASSYESLPSAPVASTTAIGSNRSSLSGEEVEPYTGPFIGRARALVDCQPSPYDRDALKFKKGDIIDIIAKNPSGLWKGCVDGRVGHFKFILVEEEVERPTRRSRPWRGTTPRRGRACTLEELLTRLHLGHLIQVFVLNGYEDLEQFRDVEKADLDCLGITDPETCAKILTAVALLHDADSEPEQDLPETLETTEAALRRGDHGRDSGCYTDHRTTPAVALDENNLDTRQSTPSTDTSSGYHSRGPYNIPLGEATLTSRDDHSSALDSPSSESASTCVTAQSAAQSEPHSYRAHLATVLPASPRAKLRQNQQGDTKQKDAHGVDFEAKYATARNVFEKEVLKREVPFTVRSPKRSTGSQSPTDELESETKDEPSVAVTDEASP